MKAYELEIDQQGLGWRWHLMGEQNYIVAKSGRFYTRRHTALRAFERFAKRTGIKKSSIVMPDWWK